MSTNTPRSPFSSSFEEDDLVCMDLRLMWGEREWGLLGIGVVLWMITLTACVLMIPVALVLGILSGISTLVLKFRKVAADKLRPKTVVNRGNLRPQSDIAAMFCRYEAQLVRGKESHSERFDLICRMAQIEKELEEHQVFSAAVARLRKEEAMPNRREAIMHSRARKKRRAEGKVDGKAGEED